MVDKVERIERKLMMLQLLIADLVDEWIEFKEGQVIVKRVQKKLSEKEDKVEVS